MFRNLNLESLGVTGRQNELIELTLTYKFDGFDIDMAAFARQAEMRGLEYAKRFIESANVKIGSFDLPVRIDGPVTDYKADLAKLSSVAEVAKAVGATACHQTIQPYTDENPYHEQFELMRERLTEIGETLEPFGLRVGINFLAAASHREGHKEPFIHNVESLIALSKTVVANNVGVCVDTWNWVVGGGTLDQIKELTVDKIITVRLADVPDDADLATVTEHQRLLPGESSRFPNRELMDFLKHNNYQGAITPYPHPDQFADARKNDCAQRAANSLKAIIEAPEPAAEPEVSEDEAPADAEPAAV